jgi:hypothetical protein
VGIIRSPVRASILPDRLRHKRLRIAAAQTDPLSPISPVANPCCNPLIAADDAISISRLNTIQTKERANAWDTD